MNTDFVYLRKCLTEKIQNADGTRITIMFFSVEKTKHVEQEKQIYKQPIM